MIKKSHLFEYVCDFSLFSSFNIILLRGWRLDDYCSLPAKDMLSQHEHSESPCSLCLGVNGAKQSSTVHRRHPLMAHTRAVAAWAPPTHAFAPRSSKILDQKQLSLLLPWRVQHSSPSPLCLSWERSSHNTKSTDADLTKRGVFVSQNGRTGLLTIRWCLQQVNRREGHNNRGFTWEGRSAGSTEVLEAPHRPTLRKTWSVEWQFD